VSKRILIVDDNDLLRTLLSQALEHAGYVPIGVESGEAALELLRRDPPDLCVIDEVMPGMSGSELIRCLRASSDARLRDLPTIGLSGWANGERDLLAAGAGTAHRKPFQVGPLLENVRALLG
jgi:CheY-like chemotaxis protein